MDQNSKPLSASTDQAEPRLPYEAPRILRKRNVRRVTLFSGGGVTTTGLTTSG